MIDGALEVFEQILCWIRQIGAMVLNAIVYGVNALLAAIAAAANAALGAWPIGMPDLPETPAAVLTAIGWIKWLPIPLDALLLFFLFCFTTWGTWVIAAPVLRWFKVID